MSAANIVVDGERYSIEGAEGKSLLEACLSLGLDLPYFCWHPAMHSVGACRQCAVKLFKDEADARGRLAMACMTPVTEGLRASIRDPEAVAFRAGVIEWLMVNHPHDCPICDEGGECHLQDMTVMTGHVRRRYRFDKRVYESQDLGPFIAQEMNRCIQCYRCLRFYRDYAGGTDFDVQGWHDSVFFGRVGDGKLESEFSGNLCEVCPTGVFTDKTQAAHPTRKWDLHGAPSVCPHCGLGCSTLPGERYGVLKRVRPRYNPDVNGYFLCDRGRYGQLFADAAGRLRECLLRPEAGAPQRVAAGDEAVAAARSAIAERGAIGIGSPRASLETNFALRSLVGPENFFAALSDAEFSLRALILRILEAAGARAASPREVEACDAGIVLGEDLWNSAPILALRLRQASRNLPNEKAMREKRIWAWDDAALREAVQDERGPFFVASPESGPLDASAQASYRASPDDIARLGFAVAAIVDPELPAPEGMAEPPAALARAIAAALLAAKRPLVVSGSGLGSEALPRAAAALFSALEKAGKDPRICLVVPEADGMGIATLASGGLDSAEKALGEGARALVVAEADLFRALGEAKARSFLAKASATIALDHCESPTTAAADIVLPVASNLEGAGSYLSFEGRIQRFLALRPNVGPARDSWRWIGLLSGPTGSAPRSLAELHAEIASSVPALAPIAAAAPDLAFRALGRRIPRGAHRESGRTSIYANLNPREPDPIVDADSALAYSMEGSPNAPVGLLSRYWAPGWNSDQAINKFQAEVGRDLKGGEIGARVFRSSGSSAAGEAGSPPPAFAARAESLLVLPRSHCLGSDELSAKAPAIAGLAPAPALRLSPPDAARLGFREGDLAEISFDDGGDALVLPFELAGLSPGMASLPWGLPLLPGPALPRRARVLPRRAEAPR